MNKKTSHPDMAPHMIQPLYRKKSGQALVQAIGGLFMMIFAGAFAIDGGLYFALHSGMQNAADAAAHAGAIELFKYVPSNTSSPSSNVSTRLASARSASQGISVQNMDNHLQDADIEFGYIDPQIGKYNPDTFSTPSTNPAFYQTAGYNAVRVTVKAASGEANNPLPSVFAKYFGHESFTSSAQAVAIYGGGISSAGGLRPVYICDAAYKKAAELFGDASKPLVTFYGSTLNVGGINISQADSCGNMGPGNWGLADFNSGGGGDSEMSAQLLNGYQGVVSVGESYGPKTGNDLNSSGARHALETLKANGTVISIPAYSETTSNGNNAQFKVSHIVGFVITDFRTNGNNTWIQGYFRKAVCTSRCGTSNTITSGNITKIRLVH